MGLINQLWKRYEKLCSVVSVHDGPAFACGGLTARLVLMVLAAPTAPHDVLTRRRDLPHEHVEEHPDPSGVVEAIQRTQIFGNP
jgi:hypothetical protein